MAEKVEKKDQSPKLKAVFQGNIQRIFVVALAVLLVVRVLIYMMESDYQAGPPARSQVKTSLKSTIAVDSPTYISVQKMIKPWPTYDKSEYHILAGFNMFDPKQIIDMNRIMQDANRMYDQADAAYKAGNLDQALQSLDDALIRFPGHGPAQALKQKIQAQIKKAEDAKTSKTLQAGLAPPIKTP